MLEKILFGITTPSRRLRPSRPAKGSANGTVRFWERAKAERFALVMTPFVEAERSAREDGNVFLSARIKTGSNH